MPVCVAKKVFLFVHVCQHLRNCSEVVFACLDDSVFITVSAWCECGRGYGVCLKNRSGYDCFIA